MPAMASGRVRTRFSLQPSSAAPPKSAGPRSNCWIIVPMAPSRTRMRSRRAPRRSPTSRPPRAPHDLRAERVVVDGEDVQADLRLQPAVAQAVLQPTHHLGADLDALPAGVLR